MRRRHDRSDRDARAPARLRASRGCTRSARERHGRRGGHLISRCIMDRAGAPMPRASFVRVVTAMLLPVLSAHAEAPAVAHQGDSVGAETARVIETLRARLLAGPSA